MRASATLPALALGLGLAFAVPSVARADESKTQPAPKSPSALPQRTVRVGLDKTMVHISISWRDVVGSEAKKKLMSGLPTVITMRGYVFRDKTTIPLALTAKSCRVVYDLWDEVFRIQLSQHGGTKSTIAVNLEGVLRQCGEARKMPLMEKSLMTEGVHYFVAGLVEVNPVSQETLNRIKRWVTRPKGSAAIGPGDSLFGSFVGLFVARIDQADQKLAFRTQAFLPPKPPPKPPPSKPKS